MAVTTTNGVHKTKGPFKLVTVNTAPERAARLIGRMAEALKDQYTIRHVANVTGAVIYLENWKYSLLTMRMQKSKMWSSR